MSSACRVDDCDRHTRTRGFCHAHYLRVHRGQPLDKPIRIVGDDWARFWSYVDVGDCWLWTGTTSRGYGQFRTTERLWKSHVYAYQLLVGEWPEHLELDHLCRVRACVNPDHLEPVTREENIRRGIGNGSLVQQRKQGST